MKYFYGESANTIKSRIGVMLIAATYGDEKGTDMFLEIMLIYVNFYSLLNHPEKD